MIGPTDSNALSTHSVKTAIVGNSLEVWKLKTYLRKVAVTDSHVLITGETGTGKELAAQYIHRHSTRSTKPLVTINCAALPDGLLESELFGYERGAFTGAVSSYAGKLKLAEGGTVVFDEIGEMSPYAQAKLLRIIESKEVYPLGGRHSVPLNIRIIAATNRDLDREIANKGFRQDLYFRLNVARIVLPPLRDRKDDIPLLIDYFAQKFGEQFGRQIEGFTDEALDLLKANGWPGNVRELMNLIERIFIDPPFQRIDVADLPESMRSQPSTHRNAVPEERELLLYTLSQTNWNKSRAAERLHWSRMTLYRKLAKYQINETAVQNPYAPVVPDNSRNKLVGRVTKV
jgi:transcriptional regulator with PAS, ATPase and Fis domain